MKENNKKKKLTLILSCIGIAILLVGVSYSLIRFIFTGNREHMIDFEGLSFSYEEQSEGLSIISKTPMSDEDGLASGNDYTFKVSSKSNIERDVDYKVYLTIFESNTLNSNCVSLNLTNETTSKSTGVMLASDLESLEDDKYLVMNDKFSFDGVTKSLEYTYKLTIWINNNYLNNGNYSVSDNEQTTTYGGETFNFKINVAVGDISADVNQSGPSEPNAPVLASNMIPVTYDSSNSTWVKADSTNTNNSWYNYTNKIWANAVTVTSANRNTYLKATPGTPIPMEDINTMLVWIPRFSAKKGGLLCLNIENPTIEKNLECYDKKSIDITDENKQKMAHGLYLYMIANGQEVTEEQVLAMMDNAIKENDTATINQGIDVYAQLLMMKHFSSFITLSTEDEALITNAFGNDFSQLIFANDLEFYGLLMVLNQSTEEITLTSDITIPSDDPLVKHYCDANGVTSEECSYATQSINSLDTNSKVEQISIMTNDENVLNYFVAKSTDMVYNLSFNKNNKSNTKYNGGTIDAPGAFDITFVDTKTTAHDAFTFGSQNLSGMWIGKFENSSDTECTPSNLSAVGVGCDLNIIRPKVLPNATSWRGAMVSTYFYDILAMTESGNQYGFDKTKDTTLDTHMLKNNEWGAVAYLTQSIYGRCTSSTSCTEVGINNNSSYVTGYGAPAGSDPSVTNGTYETTLGIDASTTGNIYGVYDMSGGADEYVMGVYTDGSKLWSGYSSSNNQHSGFNGWLYSDGVNYEDGVAYPSDNKYYNVYTTDTEYLNTGLQHAMSETSYWYSDLASFVRGDAPWVDRGGGHGDGSYAGVFYFAYNDGYSNAYNSSRSSIIIN